MISNAPPPPAAYSLCDSVLPDACAGYPNIATYIDGPYAADPADLPYHDGETVTVDVSGSRPDARALDIEPQDATPADADAWVREHNQVSEDIPILYTDQDEWPQVRAAVAGDGPVRFWVANPGGGPLPGAWRTQVYWGPTTDLSR